MTTQRSGTNPPTVAKVRRRLLQQHRLTVIKRFDTYWHTNGTKDVTLVALPDGRSAILRIGEARPPAFFPRGYSGRALVIPRLHARAGGNLPYELEAYLAGRLTSEGNRRWQQTGTFSPQLLRRLIAAFWEFQTMGKNAALSLKFKPEKISRHLKLARPLLRQPQAVERIIRRHQRFWLGRHPAKWKFAPDNLILTTDGKIGLIDNAGVGLRYLGYDLGWLLWPGWVTMATSRYANVRAYLAYLDRFEQLTRQLAPPRTPIRNGANRNFLWLRACPYITFSISSHLHAIRASKNLHHRLAMRQIFMRRI